MKTKTCPECGDKMPATAGEICRDCMQSAINGSPGLTSLVDHNLTIVADPDVCPIAEPMLATMRFVFTPMKPEELVEFHEQATPIFFGHVWEFEKTALPFTWGRN